MNLSPQDFKALLSSLDRISEAIEGKQGNCAVEVVNRFSSVFRMLKMLKTICERHNQNGLAREVQKIIKTYAKISNDLMLEDQK